MRILFDHHQPFALAHGGFQIQIEQSKAALERAGVTVDFLRWWDASQSCDLIHCFGLPPETLLGLSRQKGIKLVISQLLGGLGARPAWKRALQKLAIHAALRTLPGPVIHRTGWDIWSAADALIAVTSWEAELMAEVFRAPQERIHVIPNAVNDFFFQAAPSPRTKWLVTAASILPVKRLVETAQAAIRAQTPYWVVGRPFSESDDYFLKFDALVRQHPAFLRFDNVMLPQSEVAVIYRQARGFVLLSQWESQSLSALEAAASGCPLLLSDLPWARSTFGDRASYCPLSSSERTARYMSRFYEQCPKLQPPPQPLSWNEVAQRLQSVYEQVLRTSR
jgi:glycosyltransferase involved in cell wall biosynthesis